MDRLTAARVFVEVAERGSLTRTAERLEMSPAMVSRYLAAMEGWVGARLLHRTTRRIGLTDAGEAVLTSCRHLLEIAEDVQHLAGNRNREPEGKLRIATSASFAEAQLTTAIVDFQNLHPRVQVELLATDRAVDLVEDRIDLAVRITNSLDPAVVARPLAQCRSVLCASSRYIERYGRPDSLESLKAHRFITHAFGAGAQYRFRYQGQSVEFPLTGTLFTNETSILRRAVLEGAGVGMLPTYYVGNDLRSGALVRLLPDYAPEPLGIHAVYLSRRHRPLALHHLLEFLVQRFRGELAPWDRDAT
ncbi:LysR family transcriptional regulator [Noviherbaspirillum sp.]|uniref:LysR family transcriptional regulator n=1 Tax=Noviherbaspirillum sp. TaxID=1926288 RepID=UPI002FDF676F